MIDKIIVPSAPIASSSNIQKTMKGNRSVNRVPEILLRKELFRMGLRYRIHYRLPGKPDIVFPSKKIAVFIDGWKVLRVWEHEIKSNLANTLDRIQKTVVKN